MCLPQASLPLPLLLLGKGDHRASASQSAAMTALSVLKVASPC